MATNSITLRLVTNVGSLAHTCQTDAVLIDGEAPGTGGGRVGGVIAPRGVIPVARGGDLGDPGTTIRRWAHGQTHPDIGKYGRLSTTQADRRLDLSYGPYTDPPMSYSEHLLGSFATLAGDLDGVEVAAASEMVWQVEAKKGVDNGPTGHQIRVKVYHRTSGGTETFLYYEDSSELSTSFAYYPMSMFFEETWGTNELLVAKYYATLGFEV